MLGLEYGYKSFDSINRMGIQCSCRTRTPTVKSVISAGTINTTRRETGENGLVVEISTKRLEGFYASEVNQIPKRLRYYYNKAIAGAQREVKEIVLRLFTIGVDEMKCLCRLLPFYAHITGLTLWKVGLNMDTVRELSESLVLVTGLQVLGIEGNDLNDETLLRISRIFKLTKNLRELWLSSNQFTDVGAIVLANNMKDLPRLTLLNLDYNYLRSEGCRTLCRSLIPRARLKVLSLKANEIGPEAMEDLVLLGSSNPPVETLDLETNYLTEANCTTLSTLYGSEIIRLSDQRPPS